MKLDKLILVNWGQLRSGDYEMGDMTLLTGETGSGKSTMLDGLQTVMTAAYKGILNYNPGQDETSQNQRRGKSKRTLESYIVGAEYSKFSRPAGAQGYMAAVFRPSKGEENLKAFTALMAASARVEGAGENRQARLEQTAVLIVDDGALSFEDFMTDPEAGECIAVEHIVRHLQARYPRVVDFHDKKSDYLCALYGRFRGKTSVTRDEAFQAAKAWVQSIAYRPIGSVHELVRDEILDFDGKQLQSDIERISGLMRQVTNLRQEGARLEANVGHLSRLQTVVDGAASAFEVQVSQEMFVAKLQLNVDSLTISAKREQIGEDKARAKTQEKSIESLRRRIAERDETKTELTARKLGIAVSAQKEDLDLQLAKATATARATLNELSIALLAAGLLEQRARSLISLPVPADLSKLNRAVSRVADVLDKTSLSSLAQYREAVLAANADEELNLERLFKVAQAFGGANEGLDRVHAALVGSDESTVLAVAAELATLEPRLSEADKSVRDLGAKKGRLASGGVNYPRHVEAALGRLREQFPQAHAQVFCDLVDTVSDAWQAAIEGYMGGSRFNIIVDTAWEAETLDFVRARSLGVSIVQGALCLKHSTGKSLPSDSIVHELKSANPIAWAYLVDQFGAVTKVADSEALRHTPRGLTQDGKGSGGRTMFTTDARDLVFGQKARELALKRVVEDLRGAEEESARLKQLKVQLEAVKQLLQGLKEPHFDASPLLDAGNTIKQAREALSHLDLKELKDIDEKLDAVKEELRLLGLDVENTQKVIFGLENRIGAAESVIRSIEANKLSRLDAVDKQIARSKALTTANPQLTFTVLMSQVEERLAAAPQDGDAAKREVETLSKQPYRLLGDAREALEHYNAKSRADEQFVQALPHLRDEDAFDPNYGPLVGLSRLVRETLVRLRSVGVYNNRAELTKAETSFHDVFTKQFCVEIKSRVDDGIRTLRQMNNELRNLKFGSDRFSIDWSKWEPEFGEYLSFFEAVTQMADSPESVDLFGDTALSPKHIEVRDRLVKLLLDDDQERAVKELLRVADYRNYRRYEIFNDSDSGGRIRLSEWGTGSGGQLETPAYIVRAAVVTNRLKLFEKGPSLKLLVNDESFAKMDETRARAVLGFLRDNLDMQVMSAMPTMKAGSLKDEFSREYSFTRLQPVANGELDFNSECDERVFKTDKMRALWARQRVTARENAKQLFNQVEPESDEPLLGAIDTTEVANVVEPAEAVEVSATVGSFMELPQ